MRYFLPFIFLALVGCQVQPTSVVTDAGDFANRSADVDDETCVQSLASYQVISPILTSTCAACHTASHTSDLKLSTNSAENISLLVSYLNKPGGSQLLLAKPQSISHGGGIQIESQAQTQALSEVASVLSSSDPSAYCQTSQQSRALPVALDTRQRTALRASILLAGRMPTEVELAKAATGETGLRFLLLDYMEEDGFKSFIYESANDQLLTDQGLVSNQAFNKLDERRMPHAETWVDLARSLDESEVEAPYDANDVRERIAQSIAQQPLAHIYHVVSNDRPYSEVLTARYHMVNDYTQCLFEGVNCEDVDPRSGSFSIDSWYEGKFTQAQAYVNRTNTELNPDDLDQNSVPAAGILTTLSFMQRYPTTDTNRNRARARWTYKFFLGVDIEAIGFRVMNPNELTTDTNPADPTTSCYACHKIMDPVAGAFQSYFNDGEFLRQSGDSSLAGTYFRERDENGDRVYQSGDRWYRTNLPPGFGDRIMNQGNPFGPIESTRFRDPIQWLAYHIVNDSRFAEGTVKFWFPAVFGREPLTPLDGDPEDPVFAEALSTEQQYIEKWVTLFDQSQYSLKALLADMMMSDMFRAGSGADLNPYLAVGKRLLTPEQLDRKLTSLFGRSWQNSWNGEHYLTDDYKLYFGGIDSDTIIQRTSQITALMSQVVDRYANDLACELVYDEFTLPIEQRRLFTEVTHGTVPESVADSPHFTSSRITDEFAMVNPNAIDEQIKTLWWKLYGEKRLISDPELAVIKELFYTTWQMRITDERYGERLNERATSNNDRDPAFDQFCTNNINWNDNPYWKAPYWNPAQTVHSWALVLNYMISDPEFIYF